MSDSDLVATGTAWGFNPPTDTAGPLTIRIADPGEVRALDKPLAMPVTLTNSGDTPLTGWYDFDDEGVRAGKTELVVNGVVKSLLVSRAPVRGLDHSTGSVRGLGVAPSNLIFTARDGLDEQALKAKLLSLVRERGVPYGIIVRRLKNPLAGDPQEAMSSVMDSIMPGMGGGGPIYYSVAAVEKLFRSRIMPSGM